jgi:SAM-dependent methyltransferase
MHKSVGWYDDHAKDLAQGYEGIDPAKLYDWMRELLPQTNGTVMDIGAGTGRDAAWFARLGHDVVAVEPSSGMRAEGQKLHAEPGIRWLVDEMPNLTTVDRLGMEFDLVTLNAVWQHVPPSDRERAFRKVSGLVRAGGLLAITLRHGPLVGERGMYEVSAFEIERLAQNRGFTVEKIHRSADQIGRADVSWTCIALRSPDDGTSALPLLRHIILNDEKNATYKLGLLRAICRCADGSAGLADEHGGEFVAVPVGLVALHWLRLYMPLIKESLPQRADNVGTERLGFVKRGFRDLLLAIAPSDLRIGTRFANVRAKSVHDAVRDAVNHIDSMPAKYITFANGDRVFPIDRHDPGRAPEFLKVTGEYLASFGSLRVPAHLWRAMRRNAAWIEPTLIAEWAQWIRKYAKGQGRTVREEALMAAMRWTEPRRDVQRAREIAFTILASQDHLRCVWTDRPLTQATLDIDHMFPWASWPCSDLWNLLPAHRTVNQRLKRDQLPSAVALLAAEARIRQWWQTAYLNDAILREQFFEEARASLPSVARTNSPDVFGAVTLHRMRLRHDQQIPEWHGAA